MKKVFAIFITILLVFTACSESGTDTYTHDQNPKSPQSITSSIFGRNVSYEAYTPATNLLLPIPSEQIIDMVQIEKKLYFLGDGAVDSLDTETGKSDKLFDTTASFLTTHGGKLYTYCQETSILSEYDSAGDLINEITLQIDGIDSVEGFSVTDDYYVLNCFAAGKMQLETHLFIYSRRTGEQTLSKKMPGVVALYPYKDNKLFTISEDNAFGKVQLNSFDAENGKNKLLQDFGNNETVCRNPAVAYCPKTDTALVYGGAANSSGDSPCCITEYSLTDKDGIVHNRYYLDVSYETRFFISVYENIVCAVSTAEIECRTSDYLNPPESITILGNATVQNVIYGFENETGILVKTAYTDYDRLVLKLMAGDDDFDIYNTGSGFHNYVDSGVYVDLKEIESLNSRISGNVAAKFMVSYQGGYFGVPTRIGNMYTEENYPEDGSPFSYSLVTSENIYYAKNIDIAEKRYSDPDGEELYKLFKFIYDNPGGNKNDMPYKDDITILNANVYLLSQNSQNSENAIRFLEYLFDAYNGDVPGIVPENYIYPNLESTENCYADWRCRPLDLISPIKDARNKINAQRADIDKNELKKLAKEAAAEVAMRIEE